jgi:cytochrome bd ubiquinol oxidase subunit I
MNHLVAGRAQMGTSLAFHLTFAILGVGLPVMMLAAEGLHLRTGDPTWRALARRWSKAFAILFAVGAVSGTIISFELGLLWPRFTDVAGRIIGLPFSLEGFAFFLEAIFLGIYLYGWDRLSPRAHLLAGVPVAISGIASAFFIVTANAWMNVPRGFRLEHGEITHIDPVKALFNPAWPTETTHMVVGALLATAFGIVSVYAVGLLRGRRDSYHRKGLALGMTAAALLAPVQLGVGDLLGRTVAQNQPAKLAAFEGLYKTEDGAGFNLGGFPVPGQDKSVLNIEIPRVLSVLAYDDAGARVRGLASFPKADRTPLTLPVRLSFLGMVGIGTYLIALSLWYWLRRRGRPRPEDWRTLLALGAAGPLAFVANELGWMVTEFGRQPWVIYGVLRTQDAITTAPGLGAIFAAFSLVYVGLAAMTVWLLRRLATGAPASLELPAELAVAA